MRRGWWLCHPGIFHKFVINLTKFIETKKFHLLAINQLRYRLLSPIKPRRKKLYGPECGPKPKTIGFWDVSDHWGKEHDHLFCALCILSRLSDSDLDLYISCIEFEYLCFYTFSCSPVLGEGKRTAQMYSEICGNISKTTI